MRFVNDDRVVFRQIGVPLGFRQENAIGHHLDVSLRARMIVKANFAAHFAAPGDIQFLGDTARNGKRGHPSGLRAADLGLNPQSRLQTHFWQLRGFARARFTGDDDHLIPTNRIDDFVLADGNGQIRRISGARRQLSPFFAPRHGRQYFLMQTPQQRFPLIGMMTITQDSGQPPPQPQPVRQQTSRQQRSQFFYADVRHAKSRTLTALGRVLKPKRKEVGFLNGFSGILTDASLAWSRSLPIPMELKRSAQGCEERATLGQRGGSSQPCKGWATRMAA